MPSHLPSQVPVVPRSSVIYLQPWSLLCLVHLLSTYSPGILDKKTALDYFNFFLKLIQTRPYLHYLAKIIILKLGSKWEKKAEESLTLV